jgi:molybdopterin/thiamine biosynthesis adenylyltransferase
MIAVIKNKALIESGFAKLTVQPKAFIFLAEKVVCLSCYNKRCPISNF